ncbi:hypothetical protein ACFYSF_22525 [Streptomyces canus]|uniref:hypothetical protein n=1 Tax=Streptomyces canus TaxID=58343 RepID=UPI003689CABB
MTNQPASRPAYEIPADLGAEVDAALTATDAARDQLGRAMLVATAAAVRDILTGCEPGAPFDAVTLELLGVQGETGALFPSGRYWTQAGEERTFTEAVGLADAGNGIHDMSDWTMRLDESTRSVWRPLCTELHNRGGRPAWRLDLVKAARALDEPTPDERPLAAMVDVTVCANERDHYPAKVGPEDQREGHVRPWFDLDTVRQIAADSHAEAMRYGHGSVDTVHVLEGTVDGTGHAVVLVVSWMYLGGDKHEQATEILQPNAEGRYAVGGHDWCWYALDDHMNPQIPFRP